MTWTKNTNAKEPDRDKDLSRHLRIKKAIELHRKGYYQNPVRIPPRTFVIYDQENGFPAVEYTTSASVWPIKTRNTEIILDK